MIMVEGSPGDRRQRKEEGRMKKRQKIQDAGGVRPRKVGTSSSGVAVSGERKRDHSQKKKSQRNSTHRFGRVMEHVPCRNQPRFSTLSVAVPASVLSNCQTKELKTLLVGQIARACTIYHVDEIVVFDDKLAGDPRQNGHPRGHFRRGLDRSEESVEENKSGDDHSRRRSDPHVFMARLLQYCECPQYLRRHFFPMHPDLQFAGLLAPTDAPHHVRAFDKSKYREGVVLDKESGPDGGSFVNCGIRSRPVEIDRKLAHGIRCTVKLDVKAYDGPGRIRGEVVSPSAPREDDGTYWGYTTRLAQSIGEVFDGCPYEGGYDLKIGTSERGDRSVEESNFKLPSYQHALIVFGGVAGIEECVDADESLRLPGSQSKSLFDIWLNTCPWQGSRTIRTEEAVLISLTSLSAPLSRAAKKKDAEESSDSEEKGDVEVDFSDESVSDESSASSQ